MECGMRGLTRAPSCALTRREWWNTEISPCSFQEAPARHGATHSSNGRQKNVVLGTGLVPQVLGAHSEWDLRRTFTRASHMSRASIQPGTPLTRVFKPESPFDAEGIRNAFYLMSVFQSFTSHLVNSELTYPGSDQPQVKACRNAGWLLSRKLPPQRQPAAAWLHTFLLAEAAEYTPSLSCRNMLKQFSVTLRSYSPKKMGSWGPQLPYLLLFSNLTNFIPLCLLSTNWQTHLSGKKNTKIHSPEWIQAAVWAVEDSCSMNTVSTQMKVAAVSWALIWSSRLLSAPRAMSL